MRLRLLPKLIISFLLLAPSFALGGVSGVGMSTAHASGTPMSHGGTSSGSNSASCATLCASSQSTMAAKPEEIKEKKDQAPRPAPIQPYYVQFATYPTELVCDARQYPGARVLRPPDLVKIHCNYRR